jgi:hypothetical protein
MKKTILILITILTGYVNAEIIELDCKYRATWDGREYDAEQKFTIDTKSNRMYDGMIEFILETQPHYYIAYPRYLFENNELLLTEKQIYPTRLWKFKFNRENLNYHERGNMDTLRMLNDSKCTIGNKDNVI